MTTNEQPAGRNERGRILSGIHRRCLREATGTAVRAAIETGTTRPVPAQVRRGMDNFMRELES